MSIVNKHKAYIDGKPRPEYEAWCGMIARCYRKTVRSYRFYGARGVQVCPEWRKSFSNFFDHVGPRPSPSHSLDRVNSNGHYEPGNVRWATSLQQGQNTSRVRFLTKDNVTLCVAEWERRLGLPRDTIHVRLKRGWPHEKLFIPRASAWGYNKSQPK